VLITPGLLTSFHECQYDPLVIPHGDYSVVTLHRWVCLLNSTDRFVWIRRRNSWLFVI